MDANEIKALQDKILSGLDDIKSHRNNDLADIGNTIGYAVSTILKNQECANAFISGVKHGVEAYQINLAEANKCNR